MGGSKKLEAASIEKDLARSLFPSSSHETDSHYPRFKQIEACVDEFRLILFLPDLIRPLSEKALRSKLRSVQKSFSAEFDRVLPKDLSKKILELFWKRLPAIREMLYQDVEAAYDGDPAAKSLFEIVLAYPGIEAITTYRLAHELYLLEVPLIPRMMTEYAHRRTGIDIHPGAKIGRRFFIDHGTGVVIGETTIIGDSVKIYQGVTLGALSFPKDERGRLLRSHKRHPTIENNVVIYSNATILGGETVIGEGSVIGGNTWVTQSVASGSKIVREKGLS